MQNTVNLAQMGLRIVAFAVRAKDVGNGRPRLVPIVPTIADVDPKPASLGSALAPLKHGHRRVVAMEAGTRKDMGLKRSISGVSNCEAWPT